MVKKKRRRKAKDDQSNDSPLPVVAAVAAKDDAVAARDDAVAARDDESAISPTSIASGASTDAVALHAVALSPDSGVEDTIPEADNKPESDRPRGRSTAVAARPLESERRGREARVPSRGARLRSRSRRCARGRSRSHAPSLAGSSAAVAVMPSSCNSAAVAAMPERTTLNLVVAQYIFTSGCEIDRALDTLVQSPAHIVVAIVDGSAAVAIAHMLGKAAERCNFEDAAVAASDDVVSAGSKVLFETKVVLQVSNSMFFIGHRARVGEIRERSRNIVNAEVRAVTVEFTLKGLSSAGILASSAVAATASTVAVTAFHIPFNWNEWPYTFATYVLRDVCHFKVRFLMGSFGFASHDIEDLCIAVGAVSAQPFYQAWLWKETQWVYPAYIIPIGPHKDYRARRTFPHIRHT
jgi:hypothetical protein